MTPATITLFLNGLMAALSAAPKVAELYVKAKDMIAALFSAGLISKEKQDAQWAYVDAIKAMVDAGIVPPHWTQEPDPE